MNDRVGDFMGDYDFPVLKCRSIFKNGVLPIFVWTIVILIHSKAKIVVVINEITYAVILSIPDVNGPLHHENVSNSSPFDIVGSQYK